MSLFTMFNGNRRFTVIGSLHADTDVIALLPGLASVTVVARNHDHAEKKAKESFYFSRDGFWGDRYLRVHRVVEHRK